MFGSLLVILLHQGSNMKVVLLLGIINRKFKNYSFCIQREKKAFMHIPDTSTICCCTESNTNSTVMVLSWEKQFGKGGTYHYPKQYSFLYSHVYSEKYKY